MVEKEWYRTSYVSHSWILGLLLKLRGVRGKTPVTLATRRSVSEIKNRNKKLVS